MGTSSGIAERVRHATTLVELQVPPSRPLQPHNHTFLASSPVPIEEVRSNTARVPQLE